MHHILKLHEHIQHIYIDANDIVSVFVTFYARFVVRHHMLAEPTLSHTVCVAHTQPVAMVMNMSCLSVIIVVRVPRLVVVKTKKTYLMSDN